jgi:hypothetical protein
MNIDIYIIDLLKYNLKRINWVISDDAEAKTASKFVTGLENSQFL